MNKIVTKTGIRTGDIRGGGAANDFHDLGVNKTQGWDVIPSQNGKDEGLPDVGEVAILRLLRELFCRYTRISYFPEDFPIVFHRLTFQPGQIGVLAGLWPKQLLGLNFPGTLTCACYRAAYVREDGPPTARESGRGSPKGCDEHARAPEHSYPAGLPPHRPGTNKPSTAGLFVF